MKVETKIKIIKDEAGTAKIELSVRNHSIHTERVFLKFGDKDEIQVNAKELMKAIQNATNQWVGIRY